MTNSIYSIQNFDFDVVQEVQRQINVTDIDKTKKDIEENEQ